MKPHMTPRVVYTGSGQFRSEIYGRRPHRTPQRNTGEILQGDYRMGWQEIHQNYIELGLRRQLHISIPRYTMKALKQFQHRLHKQQQQPLPTVRIKYGTKKQYATQESKASLLDAKGKKSIISKLQPQASICRYIWDHLTICLWNTDNLLDGK